ncbi:hypothetical protein, partial [Streptococcus iniae]|uniref:hypothetical protein n=1 Tax=Streptococcus iniae TaxID=1346 RepID=UPI00055FFDDD
MREFYLFSYKLPLIPYVPMDSAVGKKILCRNFSYTRGENMKEIMTKEQIESFNLGLDENK